MPNTTTLGELLRTPIDGTEFLRLATPGANWKATLASAVVVRIGTTPIAGGTDTRVLFDKAGVVGEDAGLTWDYTNKSLAINTGGSHNFLIQPGDVNYNAIIFNGVGWGSAAIGMEAGAAGDNQLYFNVPNNGAINYSFANGNPNYQLSFANFGMGANVLLAWANTNNATSTQDTSIGRNAAGIIELTNTSSLTSPCGFQVYNITDTAGGAPTNYERAVFDWTTTSNVLTIGTQKGGTGSTRAIGFTIGGVQLMTLDTGGHLLVSADGTTYPNLDSSPIQLVQNPVSSSGVSIFSYGTANNQASLNFYYTDSNTNAQTQAAVPSGDWLGAMFFRGSDGFAFQLGAWINAFADATFTAGSSPTGISIYTAASGSHSPAQRWAVTSAGNIVPGTAAIATNATDGFTYIATCAGTPTGTPTTYTGRVAMVYDTTNHKFYIYDGAWKGGTNPGVFT